ncbi:MAG: 3'-5' exonuclease, partial [candidate division NC10 bacterium]
MDHRNLSPSAALTAAMDILGLCAKVSDWTEPARRNTHLDGLLALARAYEEGASAEGRAVTLTGFISHLEELESDGSDDRTPPHGLDAVNILTYHKAKGLEWPIVVLAQLDKTYSGDPCAPWVEGGDPKRGKPLDGRAVHYWPCPFGDFAPKAFKEAVQQTDEYNDLCRKELEESIRILYVGFTRAK